MFGKNLKNTAIAAVCLASLFATSGIFTDRGLASEATDKSREGLPGRRVGGGTRGQCSLGEKSLMALIPKTNLAQTVATRPTLFFYVPGGEQPKTVEFVLLDENDRQVYEKTFTVTGGGIITVSPSEGELPPLTIGKNYQWYFSVICNSKNRAEDISVDGWVRRIEPNSELASSLAKASLEERVSLYTSADLWQDAIVALATLRRDRPNDPTIAAKWANLLQSAGLEIVAQEPLVASRF